MAKRGMKEWRNNVKAGTEKALFAKLQTATNELRQLPPGQGDLPVPSVQQFVAVMSGVTKVYRNPDEAYQHLRENSRNMRRDPIIMEPLRNRQLSCAGGKNRWEKQVAGTVFEQEQRAYRSVFPRAAEEHLSLASP